MESCNGWRGCNGWRCGLKYLNMHNSKIITFPSKKESNLKPIQLETPFTPLHFFNNNNHLLLMGFLCA